MKDNEIKCEKCFHKSVCEKKTCAECQGSYCDKCELYDLYNGVPYIEDCEDFIDADLINRQQAHIEQLKENIDALKIGKANIINIIKAEAIKELMFNLDEEISTYSSNGKGLNVYAWLKNYVKEMVGDAE